MPIDVNTTKEEIMEKYARFLDSNKDTLFENVICKYFLF
jgi:hypothetical protein